MSGRQSDSNSDESKGEQSETLENEPFSVRRSWPSRRRFLRAAAAAGVIGATGRIAAQDGTPDFVLGGDTEAWMGREPGEIADEENPTLTFEEGETYVLEWENVDGQPHNFVIEDADGNDIVETEVISEQGATQQVEFEATRAMSEYYCAVHPESMRGDISLGEETGDGEQTETPEGRPAVGEGFFSEGPSVGVSTVAEGMTAPTDFAMAEDGRMYVTDQTGELWVVQDGERQDEPAIDVSDRMVTLGEFNGSYADPESAYDERGLLGVELHPGFGDNGRLFLHYSAPPNEETPEGWDHVEVVSEFQTAEGGTVDPDSEQVLMEFQSPQYNHDAGPMAFGPDGYLHVPMGDGGGANDEMYGHVDDWYDQNAGGNGQNVTENLLGGIHRIDVDADGDGDRPYGIPEDNPLVDDDGMDEYYAWGFRNPFGISFDSEGRMFVADAGQNLFEEANVVESGGNYGWNVKEGTHCFSTDNPGEPPAECPDSTPDDVRGGEELIDPIVEYPHNYQGQPEGIVIAGGHVYEADAISEIQGHYVFGDWTRDVARADPDGRVLVASDPDGEGATGDGGAAGNETAGNATAANETGGNATAGNETAGNETAGNETNATGDGSPGETIPRDELWNMAELRFAGSEDGRLHRFVRQFGQGTNGEVFVLVNQRGVPEGDTGAVLELVPAGEGEEISTPEPTPTETPVEDPGEEPGNETAGNETAGNETVGNETAGNETTGNETGE